MKKKRTIEINAAQRILRLKDALSGIIFTGTDKIRSGYGNGDCLYFDFHNRVFAVADGTERFPWASRDILCRLSCTLNHSDLPLSPDGWKELINQRVYSEQKYQHKTTFSCVAVRGNAKEISLTVAHGGDSTVLIMDSSSGDILFQTGRNMVFAGRSREIIDVIQYSTDNPDIRVVIHSDGFEDLLRYCIRHSLFSHLSDLLINASPVDDLCEKIHRILKESGGLFEYDDIAFIVFDPFRICGFENTKILIGGTQPHEEKRFRAEQTDNSDVWIPEESWINAQSNFRKAGITVQDGSLSNLSS